MWSKFVCPLGPFLLAQSHMVIITEDCSKTCTAVVSILFTRDAWVIIRSSLNDYLIEADLQNALDEIR